MMFQLLSISWKYDIEQMFTSVSFKIIISDVQSPMVFLLILVCYFEFHRK